MGLGRASIQAGRRILATSPFEWRTLTATAAGSALASRPDRPLEQCDHSGHRRAIWRPRRGDGCCPEWVALVTIRAA
jgi:hypothetical protein